MTGATGYKIYKHQLTPKGNFWDNIWRGPALGYISNLAVSKNGDFIAFTFDNSHRLELWDMHSYPCRMTFLGGPVITSKSPFFIECIHVQWSSQNSHLACIYRYRSSRRGLGASSVGAPGIDTTSIIVWDVRNICIAFSARLPMAVQSVAFVPNRVDLIIMEAVTVDSLDFILLDCTNGTFTFLDGRQSALLPFPVYSFNQRFAEERVDEGARDPLADAGVSFASYASKWHSLPAPLLAPASTLFCEASSLHPSLNATTKLEYLGCIIYAEKSSNKTVVLKKAHFLPSGALSADLLMSTELKQCAAYIEFIDLSPRKDLLLIGFGSFSLEVRDALTLELVSRFDSTVLNVFSNSTKCIGASFVQGIGLCANAAPGVIQETWVSFSVHACGDHSLSHHTFSWEIHQNPQLVKSQSSALPRKNIVRVVTCPKRGDSLFLAYSEDMKIWVYRQELVSNFAGPMYPPGFVILPEISTYIEAEDELDNAVINSADAATVHGENGSVESMETSSSDMIILDEEEGEVLPAGSNEQRLRVLPSNLDCQASAADAFGSTSIESTVSDASFKSLLPVPSKLWENQLTRYKKDVKIALEMKGHRESSLVLEKNKAMWRLAFESGYRDEEKKRRDRVRREQKKQREAYAQQMTSIVYNLLFHEIVRDIAYRAYAELMVSSIFNDELQVVATETAYEAGLAIYERGKLLETSEVLARLMDARKKTPEAIETAPELGQFASADVASVVPDDAPLPPPVVSPGIYRVASPLPAIIIDDISIHPTTSTPCPLPSSLDLKLSESDAVEPAVTVEVVVQVPAETPQVAVEATPAAAAEPDSIDTSTETADRKRKVDDAELDLAI